MRKVSNRSLQTSKTCSNKSTSLTSIKRVSPVVGFIGATLFLSSCASVNTTLPAPNDISTKSAVNSEIVHVDMISTDLVSALMQLQGFSPWVTTVQLSDSDSLFGQSLLDTFKSSGFGVQHVLSDGGNNNVSHKREIISTQNGQKLRYSLTISDVEIAREFTIKNKLIFPVSPLFITGSTVQRIAINDDLYRQQGGGGSDSVVFPSGVQFTNADGTVEEYDQHLVNVNPGSMRSKGESISKQRMLIAAKSRVLFNRKINTHVDIKKWTAHKQVVLNFPTTKTSILGGNNKKAILELIRSFDSEKHGLSIAGCAANKSLLWDGTELDSLDRQRRVFDELLVSGVPADLITESGCYGSQFNDVIPKQGVVLTMRLRSEET